MFSYCDKSVFIFVLQNYVKICDGVQYIAWCRRRRIHKESAVQSMRNRTKLIDCLLLLRRCFLQRNKYATKVKLFINVRKQKDRILKSRPPIKQKIKT